MLTVGNLAKAGYCYRLVVLQYRFSARAPNARSRGPATLPTSPGPRNSLVGRGAERHFLCVCVCVCVCLVRVLNIHLHSSQLKLRAAFIPPVSRPSQPPFCFHFHARALLAPSATRPLYDHPQLPAASYCHHPSRLPLTTHKQPRSHV